MGLVAPLALALLALALPIIILYMLKLRRQDTPVSSVLLWERAVRDRQANAPWQRLQKNLLLILQLLLLLLLVLGLARPFFTATTAARGNLIVLLDVSASMGATDVSPSRFDAALGQVRQMIDDLGRGEKMTLIAVSNMAEVLAAATDDKAALRQGLARARLRPTTTNMADALTLAVAAAERAPDAHIVIVGDGAFAPPDLQGVPVPVSHVLVGKDSANLAITALAVRDSAAGPQLFARLTNFGSAPARALLSVQVDGAPFDARDVALAPRSQAGVTLADLPAEARLVAARLDVREGRDGLALDNAAWVLRSGVEPARVLLVTPGNLFLERALRLVPNLQLFQAVPGAELPRERYDLYVFDGGEPAALPNGNLLLINPPASSRVVSVTGQIELPQVERVAFDDPLLRYADLRDLQVATARAIAAPAWGRPLVEASGGPLLLVGETAAGRRAVLAFDLHQSDLPLRVAFPVLVANLMGWLSPRLASELPVQVPAGEAVALRTTPGTEELVVETPDGTRQSFPSPPATLSFAATDRPGLYQVIQRVAGQETISHFVVNLLSEAESDLAPHPLPEKGTAAATPATAAVLARRELWRPLLLVALALAMVEWWVYHRGTGRWKMGGKEAGK